MEHGLLDFVRRGIAASWRRALSWVNTKFASVTCKRFGHGSFVAHGVRIGGPNHVTIGSGVHLYAHVRIGAEIREGWLVIHDDVQINESVHLDYSGGLMIESGVLVSESAYISTHSHGLDPRSRPMGCPKTIARGAWIGARAIILPSCTAIGEGAIVGAGAVVTKDVKANAVVAGNPAVVIGTR